jgi:argininosuccinate lyase
VQKANIPFRTAYYITKDVVALADKLNKDMSELTIDELRDANENLKDIDEEIIEYLNLRNSMNARTSFGGTSTQRTQEQIDIFQKWLETI